MNGAREVHEVPGTTFLVDGFKFANEKTKSYFLTHFHGDHYTGLSEKFHHGTIYCSEITYRLATSYLGVKADLFQIIKTGATVKVEGVTVHAIDANHCPGALQLVFQVGDRTYIHSGDLRYHSGMKHEPILQQLKGKVDAMYIDTTYANPKHTFIQQKDAISQIIATIEKNINVHGRECLQVFISAYNIGKERVLLKLAKTFNCKIHVDEKKYNILLPCIIKDKAELEKYFTMNEKSTFIHCVKMGWCGELWPYFRPNYDNMSKFVNTKSVDDHRIAPKRILGFIPSGWADGSKYNKKNSSQTKLVDGVECSVNIIPYSEHSNYNEILEYLTFMKPTKIIPTVYKDRNDRRRIEKLFRNVTNRTDAKRKFINAFFGARNGKKAKHV